MRVATGLFLLAAGVTAGIAASRVSDEPAAPPEASAASAPLQLAAPLRSATRPPPQPDPAALFQLTAPTVDQFVLGMADELCDKIESCGFADPAAVMLCRSVASRWAGDDVAARVAAGDCTFDADAARTCLEGWAAIDCAAIEDDPASLLPAIASMISCADALVCA
jgi:hypothetical protein